MDQKIAEPDYDFKLETYYGADLQGKVFFSNEIVILKCTSGSASIFIDRENLDFLTHTNFLLADGLIFKIIECSVDFQITALRFSHKFMNVIYPMLDGKTIEVMRFSRPDLYKKEDLIMMDLLFCQLCALYYNKNHVYRNKIAVNITLNYILEIYQQTYQHVKDKVPKKLDHRTFLIDSFYNLCKDEYMNHRHIEYYSNRMNITSRYLYKICKENLQMTPKRCIDYIILGNIKKLLLTTNLTLQQISIELNFPDQATFGQFFKRNVGMAPSEFRRRFK